MANQRGFARHERVAGLLRRELAVLIQRQLKDPEVGFISVSDVEVSRDLAHAKVFVTVGVDEDPQTCVGALNRAAGFLRTQLGRQLRLRSTPALKFLHDTSIETGAHMEALLASVQADHQEEE